jgi:transcriptional regulator with XRE-family HTH domain
MLVDGDESLDFGSLLRRLRLERSLTQETLAERARLSPQSISSLERGTRRAPYRHTVNLLADALELDVAQREALLRAAIRPRSPRMRRPAKVGATHDVRHPRFPAYATRFIGRERELTELAELVDRARLVVVCGFGGVGKTRLAIECAARRAALDRETHFIELTALRDAALVAPRIASAFQLADGAGLDALIEALRERALTLLLDNCESVIDECARIVETLVRGCPNVRVLATSREPFQIDGEAVFRLDALDPGDAAIELFLDRLAASRGTVLETSSVTAARIVRRLDGIPLAIELAAGLARTRDLGDILESLSSVEFLTIAERRSTVGHHRTMHAAIAWSYDALSPDEREDLRQLSYLAAGTTRSGAVALCARDDDRVLRRLVDASLVREDRATGRFTLHEITRQFVAPQSPPEELRHAADRYAAFLGERMRAAFDTGWTGSAAEPLAPFGPLVAELENVRQAFTHALDTGNKRLDDRRPRARRLRLALPSPRSMRRRLRLTRSGNDAFRPRAVCDPVGASKGSL